MPGGKETRLLHLGEMEKLDKTLFRLEQGRSGAAGGGLLDHLLLLLLGGETPRLDEREMAGSSPPSSDSNGKGAQPEDFFPRFNMKQFLTCLFPLQSSVGSSWGLV